MATTQTRTCPKREDDVQIGNPVRLNEIVACAGRRNEPEIRRLSPAVLGLAATPSSPAAAQSTSPAAAQSTWSTGSSPLPSRSPSRPSE